MTQIEVGAIFVAMFWRLEEQYSTTAVRASLTSSVFYYGFLAESLKDNKYHSGLGDQLSPQVSFLLRGLTKPQQIKYHDSSMYERVL